MRQNPTETGVEVDESERLDDLQPQDAIVFLVFWTLAVVVFLQFFTRYVLNNSLGWTEEIARYLLIGVTFVGAVTAVRKESHIAVELVYRWLPRRARFALQIAVDLVALAFYGITAWLCVTLAQRTQQMMGAIDLPKSIVYWAVAACFAAMTVYGAVVLVRHLRTGTSRLVDPERFAATGPTL
ncbi:TRAP transporter small permease [Aquibium carbonis]|uniref:TRAP transporter small permease protein n=1 Tax=Aquibium carbonis TaxID=2495581 RepID=A0A3S0ATW8_9HYPH|nr:TRAP transporter small permease [Aquibium carbonis]RST87000.1 TRAP transporter small permease [Aquibium carbonis]